MSGPVLHLDGVSGGYGEADILHEVSLVVEPGQIVVVIGPNGAGKSTAMRAVFGLLRISAGRVRFFGDDITGMSTEDVVRSGICYVPQTGNVFPNLSVEENLEMGAYIRTDDWRPRMREIYEMFPPLVARRRAAAGTLSGGERQMVAIGKALMLEPKLLLLDEPTAGLSPAFQHDTLMIVKDINAAGVPILMVEQNAKQALQVADRGYVLVDGQNRIEDDAAVLLERPDVAEMFLGG